jgi:hypothetical protein
LTEIASSLRRSERSAQRYIRAALGAKFFHSVVHRSDGLLEIRYCALKRIARSLNLNSIGPIAEFPLEEIHQAKTIALEAIAEYLQQISYWLMKKEWGKYAEGCKDAFSLLNGLSDRRSGQTITRGRRLIYFAPHWRPFGASQFAIANYGECSERTVNRHLSDSWRVPRGMQPINKAQTARQILEDLPKPALKAFCREAEPEAANRLIFLGKRLFLTGPCLYDTGTALRSQRFRKSEYLNGVLQAKTNRKGRGSRLCLLDLRVLQEDDKTALKS